MQKIADNAFSSCKKLVSVVLNEGLEVISDSAFSNSTLETIVLPATLREIHHRAFEYCDCLKTVYVPAGELRISYDFDANIFSAELVVSPNVKELTYHPAYQHFGLQKITFTSDTRVERIC